MPTPNSKRDDDALIAFVQTTTIALTTISEATRGIQANESAAKDLLAQHMAESKACHEQVIGKLDGLLMMFKYVILPLVAGILALVGAKLIFNLPT